MRRWCQVGRIAERVLDRRDPALGDAGADRRAPRPARSASPSMSAHGEPGVGDGREAGVEVSVSGARISRRPIVRHADAGDRDPVLELVGAAPSGARRPRAAPARRRGAAASASTSAAGREQREPHVVVLLEPHLRRAARSCTVVGLDVDDVRREPDARVLVERDDRHDVRRRRLGQPLLHVDRAPDDRGRGPTPRPARAPGAGTSRTRSATGATAARTRGSA